MKKLRGFYFNTHQNKYYYDDISGVVECRNDDSEDGIIYGDVIEKYVDTCDVDYVKNILEYNGSKQLILILTEACNMRCKYCVYSGEYTNQRSHTAKKNVI